jgi:predicted kinase
MRVLRPDDLLPKGEGRWTRETVGEAFAACARALRDEVLPDPAIRTVIVMVGLSGAGKTTWCARQPEDPSTVVYDVVNADAARRAALAKRITAAGKDAVVVWVQTPITLCLARQQSRPPWRQVPEAAIRSSAINLRRTPPTLAEGWTRIELVDGTR